MPRMYGSSYSSLLRQSDSPSPQSYLIQRFGQLKAGLIPLIDRLDLEPDVSIRRAIILALGGFDEFAVPLERRETLIGQGRLGDLDLETPSNCLTNTTGTFSILNSVPGRSVARSRMTLAHSTCMETIGNGAMTDILLHRNWRSWGKSSTTHQREWFGTALSSCSPPTWLPTNEPSFIRRFAVIM